MEATQTDDRMTNAPILGQFIRFTVPAVLGMLAISSAGIVDGLIVGNYVGAEALAAVTIVMPIFSLLIGIMVMLSVGSAVMAGKFLGEKNPAEASNVLGKTTVVITVITSLLALVALTLPQTLVQLLGAQDELVVLSVEYLQALAWGFPFLGLAILLMQFLRVDGKPGLSLVVMVSVTIANIILDVALVVYFDMGLAGAAWATAISYILGFVFALLAFVVKPSQLHVTLGTGSWSVVYRAALNGISEFLSEASGGIVMLVFNWILMTQVGSTGVASFAIVNYLIMVGFMIFYGIAEGMGALFAVNFGARKSQRVAQLLRYGLFACLSIGVAFTLLIVFQGQYMVQVFAEEGDAETIALAVSIAMVVWPIFLFAGANIVITGYFTGLQKPALSATLAILRSLVLPVSLILLLLLAFGYKGVFYALPVAEFATLLVALMMLRKNTPNHLIG